MAELAAGISGAADSFDANRAFIIGAIFDMSATIDQAYANGVGRSPARHLSRGNLAPRDRVARLLDPGSPFLEIGLVSAHGKYGEESTSAGLITGVDCVRGCDCMIVCNVATAKKPSAAWTELKRSNQIASMSPASMPAWVGTSRAVSVIRFPSDLSSRRPEGACPEPATCSSLAILAHIGVN